MKRTVSMLNDVMGPVMRGPSSSHTAGGFRIGRLCTELFESAYPGKKAARIVCRFDPRGSYAPTYQPLGVDLAFAAGVLGREMTDTTYETGLKDLAASGVDLSFQIEKLPERRPHPNAVHVQMRSAGGDEMTIWARSVGGGLIEIYRLNDWTIDQDGKLCDLYIDVATSQADAVTSHLAGHLEHWACYETPTADDRTLLHWQGAAEPGEDQLTRLRDLPAVYQVYYSRPVFSPAGGTSIADSMEALLALADQNGWSLGQAAVKYEAALLDLSEQAVGDEMMRRYAIMKQSIIDGFEDAKVNMQLTRPTASKMRDAEREGRVALGGILTRTAIRAMACMHVCNSRGVVCAAPTGGSAGVVPAVIYTLEEERSVQGQDLVHALYAAAAIGLIFAKRATFAAESAGCQVEIGAAGAMASAAVVESVGGSASEAADAAAISLQNTMGLVCDPVGGACEIPCVTRNGVAAGNAFLNADLILGGYQNHVPLDETIDASYSVGTKLPCEVRCTAKGGLAVAPSALKLAEQAERRRQENLHGG
ncbi:MAG: serine dehydratase subunit alpha [Lysobacteraceae bacterium]|nr:MAG: serine dehydratase subunit alpha [Xanthomonadaceae bacterium]